MHKRYRTSWIIGGFICLITVVCIVGYLFFTRNYAVINGNFYRQDIQALNVSGTELRNPQNIALCKDLKQADLRGTGLSVEDYQALHKALPNCKILWDVPFQGSFYSQETESMTLSALTEADRKILEYLPNLKKVDAAACPDYDQLAALQKDHPDCDVCYSVPLCGQIWDCHSVNLKLKDVNIEEMNAGLAWLPHVTGVHFSGKLPTAEQLTALQNKYPTIYFTCDVDGQKITLGPNIRHLELNDIPLTYEDAVKLLSYFPKLEKADMLGCGLTDEEMCDLAQSNPNCFYLWEMTIADQPVRTDAEEIDFSGIPMESTEYVESMLDFFPNVKKVVMCDCGIDSETMDDLNQRYEDVRFVWSVQLGVLTLRTDADFFAPVVTGAGVSTSQLDDLKYCTDIVAIDLGHQAISAIPWAAYLPKLEYLIIADTSVDDITPLTGCTSLRFLEMFQTPCKDYSPLATCTGLEDLNLCWTYGSSDPIREMKWLKRLWWDGCYASTHDLAEDLPDTECNFHSGSSTGDSWRLGQLYKNQRDIIGMPYMIG